MANLTALQCVNWSKYPECGCTHTCREGGVRAVPAPPSSKTVTPARLRNVADWLMNGCDVGHAAVELRMLAQDLESASETSGDYEQVAEVHSGQLRWTLRVDDPGYESGNYPLYRRAQKTRGEQALDELTAQAQELGMGYGGNEPRCKTCLQPYDGNMHMCPGFPPPGVCP